MKVLLLPLYSQLNHGSGICPIGCTEICRVKQQAPNFGEGSNCPLSTHQAQTCAEIIKEESEVIFNTSATGDGKSLAAYLATLLNPQGFHSMALYPTIELVVDQEKQIDGYLQKFNVAQMVQSDSLYGSELARRVEIAEKGNKFKELLISLKRKQIILTNPDIFHLVTHFRYYNPAYSRLELPIALTRIDLYIADEFHIFGVHQEAAILNSLLLIRQSRPKKRPLKVLFTSATPRPEFISKLRSAGFKIAQVAGNYVSRATPGFRQISQAVNLEFVQLDQDTDSLTWLIKNVEVIREILLGEVGGRGLIILNSVALVNRAVRELQKLLLPDIQVWEISGRIDRAERTLAQQGLQHSSRPVLVIGTSAVDVGVDFKIHLLIFETTDSATFIQRNGRLGRHPGFSRYQAFVLLPSRTPWIMARLQEKLTDGQSISRIKSSAEDLDLIDVITEAFSPPREFEEYRNCWGTLQAQGMLFSMMSKKDGVIKQLQDRVAEDLRLVYGERLDQKRGHWLALGNDKTKVGQVIQDELLRFRGGSDLQAAVWDETRFYTYDLLRLLPYALVEIISREEFLQVAQTANHVAGEFPEKYIQVYLKIHQWSDERFPISLLCDRGPNELKQSTLSLIDKLSITGHPQIEVSRCLKKQKLLTFLVPVNRHQPHSHWDVSRKLYLNPTFGLYRLQDADERAYACAFNQDALLLYALKWRLKPFTQNQTCIF